VKCRAKVFATLSLAVLSAWLSACQSTAHKGLIGDYKIGERVQIGPLVYNVYETQYLVKSPDSRVPKERFFIVHLSVMNGGAAQSSQSIPAFSLVDDAGQSYNESENGAGVAQWLGFARKIRSAESLTGDIVFDVAPKHYKLRIADETDEHYAFVDLPLDFGEPAPRAEAAAPSSR